ncbi:hypothetical protein BC343_07850 [Mucilaginibacter pedocola]|uniref:PKD domain-containing protein n=2 Tax=Mucilaginibacter pedocola TaxID=1792845 RepID=A0A1S9PCC8_9SPHI|nr:hypothetical protein BC343_07850 [Mucilaginibacter pedocola]
MALLSCKKDNGGAKPGTPNNTTPYADFSWSGELTINSDILFTNSSKNADSYKWDFGDGQTSTKANPDKIKYTGEGVYDVILTAIKGERRMVSKQTIYIAPDNNPAPFFTYTFKDGKDYSPATVVFKNQSVNAQSYKWAINGVNYYEASPTYTFPQPGEYLVSLTAINGDKQATYSDVVKVAANQNPQAAFVLNYHPYPYKVGEQIQLVNQSKNADSWEWEFGTNGPPASTDEHPEVTFIAAGNYAITLIAKKGALRSVPKTITLKINP